MTTESRSLVYREVNTVIDLMNSLEGSEDIKTEILIIVRSLCKAQGVLAAEVERLKLGIEV